ncbi:exported hypothetical protein [Xanthomonas phaseoli pv. phaseoli]|uniref:NAD-dependent epimerase/dehydratase domain-containing protein n=1 Tax=Xanthomonas campestris pv. phaseoli TaxID=317013 RepID=A0AB38DVK9_XANCH|nr:exported hypothetical protein [Xanthomonas phaseoli pv. phaseoli]SON76318.1 exported hypothetical protein [Xanthomonas phaseoli pv. phaseoli]SON80322.1 exported hypothetical protein [Xanthomonas phaseoli pv. phaseoli]SOO30847.1 exported hypothetical protein [Xanthomonas phaseoli pv. phaseoli]
MRKGIALIVGVTGISGYNLANVLLADGWTVYGLARRPLPHDGVIPVAADLLDADSTNSALRGLPITHVFFCTWTRRDTERENVQANGAMMRHLCDALSDAPLQHMALVTGTKHYLGAFENYGSGKAETPFRESEPRQPGENFYYTLEDLLFAHAQHAWLRLERTSLAHHDRHGQRQQRHEHGRDAGGVCIAVQAHRAAVRVPRLASAVEQPHRPHRCRAAGPPTGLGRA